MIGALLLIFKLSLERVPVLRYRPDILRKLSPCLYTDQSTLRALTQQSLSNFPGMDTHAVTQGLVISGLCRGVSWKLPGIAYGADCRGTLLFLRDRRAPTGQGSLGFCASC